MPTITETLQRAVDLHKAGNLSKAERLYRGILAAQPRCGEAHHLLGVLAHQAQRSVEAIAHIRAAVEIDHSQATYFHNLSLAALAADRSALAVEAARRAVVLDPHRGALADNLGHVLLCQGRLDEAVDALREAVRLAPNSSKARHNLSAALTQSGRADEAAREARLAISLAPDYARAHNALALALQQQGHTDAAAARFDRAAQLDTDDVELQWNRSLAQLSRGEWSEGWSRYEQLRGAQTGQLDRRPPRPAWLGQPLAGKTILVYGVQGIGDEIMFASCLPDVIDQAGRCLVECDDRLRSLMVRSLPGARVVGRQSEEQLAELCDRERVDVAIAADGLPKLLRPTPSDFPNRGPFLAADPARVDRWRGRLDELGPGQKIGLSWRGGSTTASRGQRSTSLDDWQPVLQTSGFEFVNLQYGVCDEELAAACGQYGVEIHHWDDVDPMGDLDELAALIASLDVIVSVDNATVHLAGALGADVWTLLSFAPEWRWLLGRDDTPWYPSMRLIRQPRPGDWTSVFRRVADRLNRRSVSTCQGGPS